MTDSPIPMRLCCEGCGKLHLDEGEFATKPHHTHSCQHCGLTWRPAVVCTVGVQFLPGFKNDPPVTSVIIGRGHIGPIEVGSSWKRKTDGAVKRVKELGWFGNGDLRIELDSGESHTERYLREDFIALGTIDPIEPGSFWMSIGAARPVQVDRLTERAIGVRDVILADGEKITESYFRLNYLKQRDGLFGERAESPFKIDDYVRCKADGRIGRVAAVNGVGDTEQPNRNRVYVRALEKPVIGWISMWFKPEEIEAWVPKEGERVALKKNSDVLTVSHVYLREPGDRYALVDGTTYIGAYQRSDFEPAPPRLSICCILNSEEIFVEVDARDTFATIRAQAIALRKNAGYSDDFANRCEIRDVKGVWIDPALEVKDLESLQGTERPTLYINPPVGFGG